MRNVTFGDVRVGQKVKFWYAGGSTPGYRTVTVAKVDADHLEGATDERGGEYRSYVRHHIGYALLVLQEQVGETLVEILSLATIKNKLRTVINGVAVDIFTGEQLAEAHNKLFNRTNNLTTKFNGKDGFTVVKKATFAEILKGKLTVGVDTVKVGSKIVNSGAELVAALKSEFGV